MFFTQKASFGAPLWGTASEGEAFETFGSEHVVFEAHSIKDMNLTLLNS